MTDLPMTFPRILIHNAEKFPPTKAAIREKDLGIWQSYSWQDYLEQVKDFALGLAALGFKKENRMAVIGDNRPQLYWGLADEFTGRRYEWYVYVEEVTTNENGRKVGKPVSEVSETLSFLWQ